MMRLSPRRGRGATGEAKISAACLLFALLVVVQPSLAQTDPLAQALNLEQEARYLSDQGRYGDVIPKLREALALWEQALGPNHIIVASSLEHLAFYLLSAKDYHSAKPLFERAVQIREQVLGPDHPSLLLSLDKLAHILLAAGQFAGAKPLHEQALRIREQTLGPDHPDVAKNLSSLALSLVAIGDYARARVLYERELTIHERALGPNHLDVAKSLMKLADVLHHSADYAGAKSLYMRALSIREQTLGPDDPDVAETLTMMASLLNAGGDYTGARPLIERALRIEEKAFGPSDPRLGRTLNSFANLLKATGNFAEARSLYERALRILEQSRGPADLEVGRTLSNLAELSTLLGEYAPARPLFERAVRIKEENLGANHPIVAQSLSALAMLLYEIGDYTASLALNRRALQIREQALGLDHPDVAVTLNNMALVLQSSGDDATALSLQDRALRILEDKLGRAHPNSALTLSNLAGLYYAQGKYAEAERLFRAALDTEEKVLGAEHPTVATSLNNLGLVLQAKGEYAGARSLYERALQSTEATLGQNHPRTAPMLSNLSSVEWDSGRLGNAVPRLAQAVGIVRAQIAKSLVGLSHRQKLAFLENTADTTDAFLSLPAGLISNVDTYRAVLDRKNLLFRTLAAERDLVEANPSPQVAALLKDYRSVRQQLASIATSAPETRGPSQYQTRFAALSQRLEALEGELSRISATFRRAHAEATSGPEVVCAAIPEDAALIDLFWYGRYFPRTSPGSQRTWTPHYIAFILRGGDCNTTIRVDLGPAPPIDEDIRRFRETLSKASHKPAERKLRAQFRKTLGTRLFARLFPPTLQHAVSGKPRILIAPDGALALVPFALLPGEDGHEFLLETRTISYVPSGRDLLRAKDGAPAAPALLAVGAPAFDQAPVQVARAATVRAGCGTLEEPFPPLPGTAAELQAIATAYQQARPTQAVTLLEGTQATKAAFLEQAPKAGILHLATHAYFAGEECTPAGLVSTPQRTLGESPAFLGYNPLLLAGIALAGANERDRADGILTALEITALDLRNTDLVVLSACDTGLGTLARGQELLGLRWAFGYAGARNLVTSLWSVPDEETATLMAHFYTALWVKGLPTPEALRAAQIEMLKAARTQGDPNPHTWGAFVVSGQPEYLLGKQDLLTRERRFQ